MGQNTHKPLRATAVRISLLGLFNPFIEPDFVAERVEKKH